TADSIVAGVLRFHRVLSISLDKQLENLLNIPEKSPANAVKQAISAMQRKLKKYEDKARENKIVVTAGLLRSHAGIFCSPRRNLGAASITMLTTSKLLIPSGFEPHKAAKDSMPKTGNLSALNTPVAAAATATPARQSDWSSTSAGPSVFQRPLI
ncbi:hypothetical protein A4X09_0g7669, partial [Tilletia walkeri]